MLGGRDDLGMFGGGGVRGYIVADPVLCVFRERAKRCGEEYDMCMQLELDSNLSFGIRIGRSRGGISVVVAP